MSSAPRRKHPVTSGPNAAPDSAARLREAQEARDALARALTEAGVQLPAMDVRTPWAGDREGEARYALVHLGVCSAPVALLLADVVMRGAAR
ncbi:hypothetical protein [Streptomyces tropicalis]|uniref:Uncharacterized protein n=1 Tax=Streptomyces tropicalis TaxID=3034234 RepID=A0ABT6A186_9ACTN|nr:hypothetical protein [Streptomyces tropicalis]MDF3298408.1 hypothetical protein [Streptomyces tropicalis]